MKILFVKFIIPMFQDLFSLISLQNLDRKGNVLDADLESKLERFVLKWRILNKVSISLTNIVMNFCTTFFSCISHYKLSKHNE